MCYMLRTIIHLIPIPFGWQNWKKVVADQCFSTFSTLRNLLNLKNACDTPQGKYRFSCIPIQPKRCVLAAAHFNARQYHFNYNSEVVNHSNGTSVISGNRLQHHQCLKFLSLSWSAPFSNDNNVAVLPSQFLMMPLLSILSIFSQLILNFIGYLSSLTRMPPIVGYRTCFRGKEERSVWN